MTVKILQAKCYGPGAIAIVPTGDDRDGTEGAQWIRSRGGTVIAQSPESCEVPDMPRSAIKPGAVDIVLPIDEIADALVKFARAPSTPAAL
jgi:two-component system chemotaxis response regulator CheB